MGQFDFHRRCVLAGGWSAEKYRNIYDIGHDREVQAGKVIAEVSKKVGRSGGGRADMSEAGGKDPAALDAALADAIVSWKVYYPG
jgi:alanyl-tRNA synthetase